MKSARQRPSRPANPPDPAAAYRHSVAIDGEKCRGCTHCLAHCPTQAIRVRGGKARINPALCIDCGECIRRCPHQAKKAVFDKLSDLPKEKIHRIALPAPSLYGQFDRLSDVDYVLQGLLELGFDGVYEVAKAAEIVTAYTRRYLARTDIPRPVISSACPTVSRLISLRFPSLCRCIIPILPPIELASRAARIEAAKAHPDWDPASIATVFISPCPAKASYVKNALYGEKSDVDAVLSMSEVYFALLNVIHPGTTPTIQSQTGMIGMGWASTGGESSALLNDRYLAADGIENVIHVLDQMETGDFRTLEFVELNACPAGCVGGAATVENPYLARVRLQALRRYLPVARQYLPRGGAVPKKVRFAKPIEPKPILLAASRLEAMKKMQAIEKILPTLPGLDCGSCGAPTCRAFAQDLVEGTVQKDDCIVRLRESVAAQKSAEITESAPKESQ